MKKLIPIPTKNPGAVPAHKVWAALAPASDVVPPAADMTLAAWMHRYLEDEVRGVQSDHTYAAKLRDLRAFLVWFVSANGHARAEDWMPRDTQGYLNGLKKNSRAVATYNRHFSTLRRFARYVAEQPDSPFRYGLPTKGVRELAAEDPVPKRLEDRDVRALFKAADQAIMTEREAHMRPRRNLAILAVLYYTGMRVSELCRLERAHLQGRGFLNLRRKGNKVSRRVHIHPEAYQALQDYLERERPRDDPQGDRPALFLSARGTGALKPRQIQNILNLLAHHASSPERTIRVHPHALRHTIAYKFRQKTGSDFETQTFLGHASNKYVGWYTGWTDKERQEAVEGLGIDG